MQGDNISAFQDKLLSWHESNARAFPWREQKDPFAVLISEKLLQQTKARSTVISAYNKLLSLYPTPEALANADINTLKELIQPLGFIYRANELPIMAQALVERHQGQVPNSLHELLDLPGVGDYGARAVLSFAFGEDLPIVDTNVARWIYRLDGISGPMPSNPARKKLLRRITRINDPIDNMIQ